MSAGTSSTAAVPVWQAMREKLRRSQQLEAIPRRALSDRIPLSSAQERLWFLCQANPGTAAYNIPFAWRLRGDLSINALRKALKLLMDRHQVFQTAFAHVEGRPYQHNVASPDLELALIDCSAALAVSRFAEVLERAGIEAAKPFALESAPLFRATVLKLSPRDHVLVLVFHHLIFDGWSRQVFLRELKLLYASALTGAPPRLPDMNLQYADFAAWERSQVNDGDEAGIQAWKQELTGALPTLDMPLDCPRPAARELRGEAIPFRLVPGIFEALENLRVNEGSTRFVVLLAGMAALLHRWTGQEDLIIGTASANRGQPQVRNMIGFFVNTLPIRFAVSPDSTFRDLVRSGQEKLLRIMEHEEVPFSKIVEAVNPTRTRSNSPLFDAMFVLQNASRDELNLPGLKCSPVRVHNGTSKFDFTFELTERLGGIVGSIEYSTEIFSRRTIRWFSRYYQSLLGAALASPDLPLHRLPISTEKERRLDRQWNSVAADYPSTETVDRLFAKRALSTPGAIAIENGKELWSYRDVDNASNALAAEMASLGVRVYDRVAICAERSPALIVAMLAILKLGGAYVPIDPALPRERVRFMLQDCSSPLLLVDARSRSAASAFQGSVLELDEVCRREHIQVPPPAASFGASGDAAYVLYTSGSTGVPKGVCVPHRAIARLVLNTNYITIRTSDHVAQAASSSFDAATFEIWGALLNGARIVILPRDVVLSPAALGAELARRKITVLFLTTALFNVLVRERPAALQTVSTVLFGGEAADPAAALAARNALPGARLLNVYGPTETTTFATWFDISDLHSGSATVPIGLPITNTEVHVLDESGRLTPIGARGEIHIGGDGLAIGYLNQPELTAERFIHAEVPVPGGTAQRRLYRTGDFGRRLPDGNIEFLGRRDKQVKIRGHRIELSEIESVLAAHPSVTACAVVVDDAGGDRRLAAFAQACRKKPATPRQLKEWIAGKLPDYMLPASITIVEALPVTTNGKLDRASLPSSSSHGEIVELKPWIPLQVQLAEIWRELLGRESVGLRDSFFDLGGHSLLAMQLIDRIEQACGVTLPVSALFGATTIEELSETILRQQFGAATPLIEVQPAGPRPPIFFLHGDLLGGGLYCLPLARQLGSDQPFFALPPSRLSEREIPTITELATAHLRVVRARIPEGPYVLGGFCISGLIALEMARALQQDGEEVPLVILADPPPPRFLRFARWCVESGSHMRKAPLDRKLDELMNFHNRLFRLRELLKSNTAAKVRAAKHRLTRRAQVAPQDIGSESRLFSGYLWSAAGHQPSPYAGRAALFCCDSVMAPAVKKLRAWSALLPNATMHVVAGEHLDLVTSRSAEMTRVLRALLPDAPVGAGTCRP